VIALPSGLTFYRCVNNSMRLNQLQNFEKKSEILERNFLLINNLSNNAKNRFSAFCIKKLRMGDIHIYIYIYIDVLYIVDDDDDDDDDDNNNNNNL